ncbi:hypothetical protein [Amycolatopsis sp. EV170708-02-1]|uniref:WXG100-like domain-containing protein n=1 Tax=Amycolatopsis sp. EV170708-02-1 TaxID=2919322 RepID=UPI001F0BC966|nr:hypothetical protein [Amycolatopsis sp. EV170708-02-1]UMP06961.1 hypothetical protein MJQ72_20050 [Amycolatopsis sp. EV170708-02-1]
MGDEFGVTRLPSELQKFFEVVIGIKWPEADEGGLRSLSGAWLDFAKAAEVEAEAVVGAAEALGRSMRGMTAERTIEWVKSEVKRLGTMAGQSRGLSSEARTAAADAQKAKIMLVVFGAIALATIIFLAWSIFTAWMIPAVKAATQLTLRTILKQLLLEMQRMTFKRAALGTLRVGADMAKFAAAGAGLMFTLDWGIQTGQIWHGDLNGETAGRGNTIGNRSRGPPSVVRSGVRRSACSTG